MSYTMKTSFRPENEDVVMKLFINGWNEQNIRECCAEGFVLNTSGQPLDMDETIQFMNLLYQAIPDMRFDIEQIISAGDMVVVKAKAMGNHTGNYLSARPTGAKVEFDLIHMSKVDKGQIIESWEERDTLSMMRNMGLMQD